MSDIQHKIESKSNREGRDAGIRRREARDTLLGYDPPRFLSVTIVVVAILLAILIVAGRSIEYEETVPIVLTLKASGSSNKVCGVAYLRQEERAKLKAGQAVRVEISPYQARNVSSIEGNLSDISILSKGELYLARVELPADFVADFSLRPSSEQEAHAQAKVVMQRVGCAS